MKNENEREFDLYVSSFENEKENLPTDQEKLKLMNVEQLSIKDEIKIPSL